MENAYIYTRVSTLIQVDGFSLEAQEAEIRAFAEARKINIVWNIRMKVNPERMPSIVLPLRR